MYEPGTRCAYTSGTGYDLLGHIVADTDPKHRSFSRIAKEELFDPLGMRTTSFGLATDHPKRVPASHTPANDGPTSPIIRQMLNESFGADAEMPSGGAFAEIDDVFLFTEALIGRSKNGTEIISPAMFDRARRNHTGDLKLETILPRERFGMLCQMVRTAGIFEFVKVAKAARGGETAGTRFPDFPANFTLLGGYVRGNGDYHNACGRTATPSAICAVGGASTGWMIDTERDLTFIFLSAGFVEGLEHPRRLSRLADLALAAIRD